MVIESHVARTQQRKPQNQVKLKASRQVFGYYPSLIKRMKHMKRLLSLSKPARQLAGGGEYWFWIRRQK